MQGKDKFTILISILALLVSGVAEITSFDIGKAEEQNAVRQQITEVLKEITANDLKIINLQSDKTINNRQRLFVNTILGQRRAILLQQVLYLKDKEPALITSIDYNTIAYIEAEVGDMRLAERYFKKAIDLSQSDRTKAFATVSYAVFLFSTQRQSEGRDQFTKALSLLHGNNDTAHVDRGNLYQIWGNEEMTLAPSDQRFEKIFESGRKEFRNITDHASSCQALDQLDKLDGMVEIECLPSFNSLKNMGIEK